jgi:hypothetical protein
MIQNLESQNLRVESLSVGLAEVWYILKLHNLRTTLIGNV